MVWVEHGIQTRACRFSVQAIPCEHPHWKRKARLAVGMLVRHSQHGDAQAVAQLCATLYGVQADVSSLLETALLCLTVLDEDSKLVLGFLCLQDFPVVRFGYNTSEASQAWLQSVPVASAKPSSSAFIFICACVPQHEGVAGPMLLRTALVTLPCVRRFFLASPLDITISDPGLGSLCSRVASHAASRTLLFQADADSVLPPLAVRRARVEDHDDMLPVLTQASTRYPALAKLPESSSPDEPFALTRVVSGQDEANLVLVAHTPRSQPHAATQPSRSTAKSAVQQLVGFMVLTREVDTSALQDAFDLHPFDCFLQQEVYERQAATARDSVRKKKMNTLVAKLGSRAHKLRRRAAASASQEEGQPAVSSADAAAQTTDPLNPSTAHAGVGESDADDGNQEEGGEGAQGEDEESMVMEAAAAEGIDLQAAAEPLEEEVKAEMAMLFGGQDSESEPTIFAVTMACIDAAFEAQTREFLLQAFDAFPDKLYCVLTLPHASPEPPLVSSFTRLTPTPGSVFPEVLYIFNRHALTDGFEVRLAQSGDARGVSTLVSGLPTSSDIQELFHSAHERGTAVVAAVGGEVVGLVTINPQVDTDLLSANFNLDSLVQMPHHPAESHGEVDMLCMNPIFAHRVRELLSGAHRLLGKSVLYYALPPDQPPPDSLPAFVQVPPRHKLAVAGQDASFALYLFSRRSAFAARQAVNAQVVVLGASEAGLAVVERLLMDAALVFNYITLLAPGGIIVGGVACEYTASDIAKLGLDARVTLLDAEMVGLDRGNRMLELSDGSQLPYDVLVVAAGLQEQTCNTHAEKDPEVAGSVLSALELANDFTVGDASVMQHVLVYGDTLNAYHALAVLESRGGAHLPVFVAPPGERQPLVSLLHECAAQLGITLPQPEVAELKELVTTEGDTRPLAVLQGNLGPQQQHQGTAPATSVFETVGESGMKQVRVDLVVGCSPHQPSQVVFMCLNNSSLVWDGRVVVDTQFRTSDPQIFAGGSIAKLSRRCGHQVCFEHYNSAEVGRAMGEAVSKTFRGTLEVETPQPPPLDGTGAAKVVGCQVPGDLVFFFAGCPAAMASPGASPEAGRRLSTVHERGVLHLQLNGEGCIHSITFLGRSQLQLQRLACLVGLHVNYLNGLVQKMDRGEVSDLVSYLTNDAWQDLLFHDGFRAVRNRLLVDSSQAIAGGTPPSRVLLQAQQAALQFIQAKPAELPAYKVSAMA
ncbi:hypothetical protein V8C86DRAFT_2782277 [Haematococcus lacustris]